MGGQDQASDGVEAAGSGRAYAANLRDLLARAPGPRAEGAGWRRVRLDAPALAKREVAPVALERALSGALAHMAGWPDLCAEVGAALSLARIAPATARGGGGARIGFRSTPDVREDILEIQADGDGDGYAVLLLNRARLGPIRSSDQFCAADIVEATLDLIAYSLVQRPAPKDGGGERPSLAPSA